MSAILSADDLNDFISPGVACIKPVETLPKQTPAANEYEVTKEGTIPEENKPAQISLTDCLACSGCVTSAEAVLISLQSHAEVLNALDNSDKLFVASVSPQVRASIAATYGVKENEAGWMIDQLLAGPEGLSGGGKFGNGFKWVVDTNAMREANLVLGAEEVLQSLSQPQSNGDKDFGISASATPKKPVLSSACPGWICYAEKTHPHVLPHLSRLKSPQALTGTLLKTVLSQRLNVDPGKIWHLAVMPCFDKKLEASREELTDVYWQSESLGQEKPPIRDVDCVITTREILMLADTRGISFPNLPRRPLESRDPFPDPDIERMLFSPYQKQHHSRKRPSKDAGPSGGYLHYIIQAQLSGHPERSSIVTRGRNADMVEYAVHAPTPPVDIESVLTTHNGQKKTATSGPLPTKPIFKAARYYGFRNIQNLVRKLKPPRTTRMPVSNRHSGKASGSSSRPSPAGAAKTATATGTDYAYVEVMACPGGCTNGGGQIKVDDLPSQSPALMSASGTSGSPGMTQKDWLARVDEAYFSMSDAASSEDDEDLDMGNLPITAEFSGLSGTSSNNNPKNTHTDIDGDVDMTSPNFTINNDKYHNLTNSNHIEEETIIAGINITQTQHFLTHWSSSTGIPLDKLVKTGYRRVDSDVGASASTAGDNGDADRVVELAGKIGGGW